MKRGQKNMNSLAPYACDPADTKGRYYVASASPTRSEYQRDRDRIIHSTAFRRLQHKTQVFLHHEGLHYRTRLTHTLEVSQIARSMARALALNEDLGEAIALAHDLGHPPFGHAGERALNEAMAEFGGFEHNLQALRTVCILENRYAEHDGMNLTWETLEGIFKHNGPVKNAPDISFLPDSFSVPLETHAPLEAQIAAIADDIAYDAHDIDDAVRAGVIELEQLHDVPLVGPIVREVLGLWPSLGISRQTHEVQRRLITRMIEDAIKTSEKNIADLAPKSPDEIRLAGKTLVGFSKSMAVAEKGLKNFLFENVYRSEIVMKPVRVSQSIITNLFGRYFSDGDLPGPWRARALSENNPMTRARLIADFIAGMTDPYALEEHKRLFDAPPNLG
jgi:dGTPase